MEKRGILKLKTEGNFAKQKTRDLIFYICMVTIPCLQFLVFWVGTNIETILLAFQSYDFIAGDYYFAGMSNFVSVFDTLVKTTDLTKSIINGLIPQLLSYVIHGRCRFYSRSTFTKKDSVQMLLGHSLCFRLWLVALQ